MAASTSVFAAKVAPAIGATLANIMWATPVFDVRSKRAAKSLGSLNPAGFVMGYSTVFGWTLYGSLLNDGFIIWANFPGISVLTFCVISIVSLLNLDIMKLESEISGSGSSNGVTGESSNMVAKLNSMKSLLFYTEVSLVVAPFVWGLMAYLSWVIWGEIRAYAVSVVGWMCLVQTLAYYVAPLTALKNVIKNKDSSSIYPPSVIANTVNCIMWAIYGVVAVHDPVVYAPNFVGLGLQVVSASLLFFYPKKAILMAAATAIADKQNPFKAEEGASKGQSLGSQDSQKR